MTDDKKIVLDGHAFSKFVNQYQDRYGEQKMSDDSASMWFEQLCHVETKQFEVVTVSLLGNKYWAFGWLTVLERLEILYPSTINQHALDALWKLEYEKNPKKQQKIKFSKILSCVPDMVRKNKSGWRNDLFKAIYDLLGADECFDISIRIQGQFPEFKEWLKERNLPL